MTKLNTNIKVVNTEALLDVSRLIIKTGFGVIGLRFKVSGGNIIDLEVFEKKDYSQKPFPDSFSKTPSDVQNNINTMLRFLGKIELMAKEVVFGTLFLKLTIKNALPYRFSTMYARKRRYTSKSKKGK